MKKYILASLIALTSFCFASVANKIYIKSGIETYIYELSVYDTVVHIDSTRQVEIHTKGRHQNFTKKFYVEDLSQVYFSGHTDLDVEKVSAVRNCSADPNAPLNVSDTLVTYQYSPEKGELSLTFYSLEGMCCESEWFADLNYLVTRTSGQIGINLDQFPIIEDAATGVMLACDCFCYGYNVNVVLTGVHAEPYLIDLQGADNFYIDLSTSTEGVIYRFPNGGYVKHSNCKNHYLEEEYGDDIDGFGWRRKVGDTLVSYQYDYENDQLYITSHDVYTNCCANIVSSVFQMKDTIVVSVYEKGGLDCDCMCYYDVTSYVNGLRKGAADSEKIYHFRVGGSSFDLHIGNEGDFSGVILYGDPKGRFLAGSSCKGSPSEKGVVEELESSSDTLISYLFDLRRGEGVVVAYDVPMSCCVEAQSVTDVRGDNIVITPVQVGMPCKCMCTYDVTTGLENLMSRVYHITVRGTTYGDVSFDVDLTQDSIVEGIIPIGIRGRFLSMSPCKNETRDSRSDSLPLSKEYVVLPHIESADTLVFYEFSPETGVLTVVSYDLEINCCTTKGTDVVAQGDTITIRTVESGERCRCLCIYDVKSEVVNLEAKPYHLVVDGVEFDVDFSKDLTGFVTR